MRKGFSIKNSTPQLCLRSSAKRQPRYTALIMIMGVRANRSLCLMRRAMSKPCTSGSIASRTISCGLWSLRSLRARLPRSASITLSPRLRSSRTTILLISASSSTTSTVGASVFFAGERAARGNSVTTLTSRDKLPNSSTAISCCELRLTASSTTNTFDSLGCDSSTRNSGGTDTYSSTFESLRAGAEAEFRTPAGSRPKRASVSGGQRGPT